MSEFKTSVECVEIICKQGCAVVRKTIDKLEQKKNVGELTHLANDQKDIVLSELKSIMSVYDETDE